MNKLRWLALAALVPLSALAADPLPEPLSGYLCCNMRSDGSWISDDNSVDGRRFIPAGTPIKAVNLGRYRINVKVAGTEQALGNDHSRSMDMMSFGKRYIVPENPKLKLATYPEPIRKAIRTSRVAVGMTREQVLMSLSHPLAHENPDPESRVWRYWAQSDQEFQVVFDANWVVEKIVADESFRHFVVME